MEHALKIWPKYFNVVLGGSKKFEYRSNDRGFKVGDILILQEWDPTTEEYTGNWCRAFVTYLLEGGRVPKGLCIMSIEVPEVYA